MSSDEKFSARLIDFYLQNSLLELNVSKNNITSLRNLRNLRTLRRINISDNMIGSLNDLCNTLRFWNDLREIELRENSVLKNKKCEAEIIATCPSLGL